MTKELADLRARLAEAEEVLRAIRGGKVDAVLLAGERGEQVYTLSGADRIYRQLVETMDEGAVTLSADGIILYGNASLARLLERPLEQIVGTALVDHLPPEDQQALEPTLAHAPTEPRRREISLKTGGGRLVPVSLSVSPLQNVRAERVFCLVLTDLTEQRRHEQIVAAGGRSAALTRQLLAFSRKQTLLPEVLDLNALLRNLEKMLGRLIGENIELEFKLAEDLFRTKADPGQIEQVITNLALNASDAMLLGGRLTVETANVELDRMYALGHESVLPGSYVLLAVTDTGCGMDKATMARVFEPFFTTKEKGKGTGLGLATAYGIVKQSGGYIWAYSEPDQGTTFKIYLPSTDAAPGANVVEAGGEAPRGNGERILLVEDEVPLRELCETVLVRLGYRVNAAGNGLKALLLVQEQGLEPDLVVTDVIMPVMSGAEMTERLRRERPELRVLYMSGYPDDTIARHGILEPGIPFIQKPFTERALAVKVREALGTNVLGSAVPEEDAVTVRSGKRILMIDDDEQFRELVRHFCRKRGHLFAGVGDAAAALAALAGQPFDVLLVDKNIPGTSGEQILREIRAAGHATPAIVLTGDVASADMDLLRPLGVVRALEKSSDAGPLLQAIDGESLV